MTEIQRVGIRGTGSYVPEKVLTNQDFEKMVDTSDEWITTRTGIKERHVVADDEYTSNLAVAAARRAIVAAEMEVEDIDLIVVATVTGDYRFPSTACLIQAALGATRAGAMDVSAACSGFLYALAVGTSQVAAGMANNVLVIGAETLTRVVDYTDRTSCILFGDGAGCVVLSKDFVRGQVLPTPTLRADGQGYDIMWIEAGGTANPMCNENFEQGKQFMRIRGREVYKFAVSRFVELVEQQLALHKDKELGLVIPHQVNLRIIESARNRLGLPAEKVYTNIQRYGNTSAASIPIALDEAIRSGILDEMSGKLIVFCAFGAGLTWASGALVW